jgi:hypothetical protein
MGFRADNVFKVFMSSYVDIMEAQADALGTGSRIIYLHWAIWRKLLVE